MENQNHNRANNLANNQQLQNKQNFQNQAYQENYLVEDQNQNQDPSLSPSQHQECQEH